MNTCQQGDGPPSLSLPILSWGRMPRRRRGNAWIDTSPVALAPDGYNGCRGENHRRGTGLVTPLKLLLSDALVPIAEELCSLLGVPFSVVSAAPAWDGAVHQIVQIDLPRLHARVFEEAAAQRGAS